MKIHYYKMINLKKNNNKKIAQRNQLPVKIVLVKDQRNIILIKKYFYKIKHKIF